MKELLSRHAQIDCVRSSAELTVGGTPLTNFDRHDTLQLSHVIMKLNWEDLELTNAR